MKRIIKIIFIKFLLPVIFFSLNGCLTSYNLATEKEELIVVSDEKEISLGESLAKQVEHKYKLDDDQTLQDKVDRIGQAIVKVCDRQEIRYHFKVIKEKEVNAASLPGGFIYVNKGLINKVSCDDELAAALAHEIGHVVAKHAVKRIQGVTGYSLFRILLSGKGSQRELNKGADIAFGQLFLAYAREDELLADRLSVKYLKKANFNPEAALNLLEKLKEVARKEPLRPLNYARTHPFIPDRIRVVKEELYGQSEFEDYINKTPDMAF
jgi:predicted Zn-dependent protease